MKEEKRRKGTTGKMKMRGSGRVKMGSGEKRVEWEEEKRRKEMKVKMLRGEK